MSNRMQGMRAAVLSVCALCLAASLLVLPGCNAASENTVVIYSCGEGAANEALLEQIHEDLPEYDIRLHYVSTGTGAARIKTEGAQSEADIILMLEGGYMRQIEGSLAPLDYDFDVFEQDLLDGSEKYLPFRRESACIAVNRQALEERGLPVPESYDDLLDPQ
ncbi:MAG: extracellular solute-binding protein, partial [Raoultibacter sp.]